jgi:hypothetical protein
MGRKYVGQRLAFGITLSVLWVALGCTGDDGQQGDSSSSGGSILVNNRLFCWEGPLDAGDEWSGDAGTVNLPECTERFSSIFQGTIDGQPYNETFAPAQAASLANEQPCSYTMLLPNMGKLDFEWTDPILGGQFIPITTGTLKLPLDSAPRTIQPGSLVRRKLSVFAWQFVLIVDGDELTGCSLN